MAWERVQLPESPVARGFLDEVGTITEALVRLALRGAAAYQLSWFDAHLWAYAEFFGLDELLSEDFQDGRLYGTVMVRNPFA